MSRDIFSNCLDLKLDFSYLLVAEEVDARDEDPLERVEEVGGERPEGEEDPGAPERVRPHDVQDVGDAQEGQQKDQRLEGLPEETDREKGQLKVRHH